jgi:predicted dehydrogenase
MKKSITRRDFTKTIALSTAFSQSWTARSYGAIAGANERLRIGIIGCGGMANSHMDALLEIKATEEVEIVAVCDVYGKRLNQAAQKTGGQALANYHDLLSIQDLDYVLIATPEHWHYQMTIDALDAGKHVYVEKPMTHTIEEAQGIVRKVAATRLMLQVGVQGMSDESYEVAHRHIQDGVLGRIVMAQIDYSRNYVGDFWAPEIDPDAKPGINLDWEAWLGPAPRRPWDPYRYFQWRRYWDYSGGIATDLFIHRITRILKAAGLTFPSQVIACGGTWEFTNSIAEIPDTFSMLLDYPGGPTVSFISSMANDTPIEHVIRGHKATLLFNRDGFIITPQEINVERANSPSEPRVKEVRLLVYKKTGAEDIRLHHRNLQAAIRKGETLHCDAQLGYYGVVAAVMGVQSFRQRSYLRWNEQLEKVESSR